MAQDPEREEAATGVDADAPMSLRTRLIAAGVLLVLGIVFVRFAIPPVAADQVRPDGHPPGECWLCHLTKTTKGGVDGP